MGTLKGLAEVALGLREMYGIDECDADLSVLSDVMVTHHLARVLVDLSPAAWKEEVLQTHTLLRWADAGLRAYDLTHSLMAALLLTDPANVSAEAVRLPRSTFAIRLPNDFWTMVGHEGRAMPASIVLVHTYRALTSKGPAPRPLLCLRIVGQNGSTSTWEIREPLPESGPIGAWMGEDVPEIDDPTGVVIPPDENDKRLCVAARRLLVNLCLFIAVNGEGELSGRQTNRRKSKKTKAEKGPRPDIRVLGLGMKLDRELLDAARAWTDANDGQAASRAAWRLRSRFVVRGHWRHQAHGPGLALRRLQWIEPFWKGPVPTFTSPGQRS